MPVYAGAVCAIALGVVVMNRNVSTNIEDERVQIDNYADLGRIIYNDNSEFRIAKKGCENVSGI